MQPIEFFEAVCPQLFLVPQKIPAVILDPLIHLFWSWGLTSFEQLILLKVSPLGNFWRIGRGVEKNAITRYILIDDDVDDNFVIFFLTQFYIKLHRQLKFSWPEEGLEDYLLSVWDGTIWQLPDLNFIGWIQDISPCAILVVDTVPPENRYNWWTKSSSHE